MPGISPRLSEGAITEQGAVIARGLQYVNAWKGKTVVVKAGGSVLESGEGTLAQDLVLLKGAGIHPEHVTQISAQGYIPVVASLGIGADGESYNLNADTAAGALAVALGASKFVLLTDVPGVYRDDQGAREVISELRAGDVASLVA